MKGIILAGGKGTRLYPLTIGVCKQLLPIFDKPMIYYPLSVLMQAGVREILIISTPEDISRFENLFQDGSHLGLQISYAVQAEPKGIAQAFIVGESFIGQDPVALILGDNIFYGNQFEKLLVECTQLEKGGIIFGYEVKDPNRYGVAAFNENQEIIDIIEKPAIPPSNFAVTGLYFFDSDVIEIAKSLKPSPRGELEITDVARAYLDRGDLRFKCLERGFAWLDTGTCDALAAASSYVQAIQERQGIKIGCIEEIALQKGWINQEMLLKQASMYRQSEYGKYLLEISQKFSSDLALR